MKALIVYWSGTGNTKKVAETIDKALQDNSVNSVLKRVEEAGEEDYYEYDLVFVGSPSHMWQPPEPVLKYVKDKMGYHSKRGDVKLCAPKLHGKRGVIFITYSGPHTGINEALPVGKYLGQFLEHIGFDVAGEWYVVGEFHGRENASTVGKLGDIRGRPNQQDLNIIVGNVKNLLKTA